MNRVLAALPVADLQRISSELVPVSLAAAHTLQEQGDAPGKVHFLSSGLCSVSRQTDHGQSIEVASIGREGIVGISALFGTNTDDETQAVMLIGGDAFCMTAASFEIEMARGGALRNAVCAYRGQFVSDLMTSVVCNALHPVEQRVARWLLEASRRAGTMEIPITHDTLAGILGVQRASVTVALLNLKQTCELETRRNRLGIRNREALARAACSCARRPAVWPHDTAAGETSLA